MKFLAQGLTLALAGAGLAAVPTLAAQAQPAQPGDLVAQIKQEANTSVSLRQSSATGKVTFLAATGEQGDLQHGTTVAYTQVYRGVPVFASTLKVNVDAAVPGTPDDGLFPDIFLD